MRTLGRLPTSLAALLLLSGCAVGDDAASSPTTPASAVVTIDRALERTRAAGSVELTVDLLTTVDGVDDAISGQGEVALDGGLGQMQWTSPAGPSVERRTADGVFVQVDPPNGAWLLAPEGTPTSGTMDPLRGLDELEGARNSGVEELSIGEAERFTGSLPAAPYVQSMGLNPTAADAVAADDRASIDVTIWVDGDGMVRRIMRTLRTSVPVAAATFTDLVDFGAVVDVPTPADYDTAT